MGAASRRNFGLERHSGRRDDLELVEEPPVDTGSRREHVHGDPAAQGSFELEDAFGRWLSCPVEQVLFFEFVGLAFRGVGVETPPALLQRSDRLLERLRKGAPDGHHLADRLHPSTETVGGTRQLFERPTGDLRDDVVDRRLEARRGRSGDVVRDLVEGVADSESGRDFGDGKARRLGSERTRPRDPRVHLYHQARAVLGVHGELDVGATRLHSDPTDACEGLVAHHLIFDVRESLGGRDGYGVAGVHTHRVEVLDRAHDDAVVRAVAHDFELELLPTRDRALHEHSVDGARGKPLRRHLNELLAVEGDPRAGSAEYEARTHHDREADPFADRDCFVEGGGEPRCGNLEPDLLHRRLEQVAVLCGPDRIGVGTDQADTCCV